MIKTWRVLLSAQISMQAVKPDSCLMPQGCDVAPQQAKIQNRLPTSAATSVAFRSQLFKGCICYGPLTKTINPSDQLSMTIRTLVQVSVTPRVW